MELNTVGFIFLFLMTSYDNHLLYYHLLVPRLQKITTRGSCDTPHFIQHTMRLSKHSMSSMLVVQ